MYIQYGVLQVHSITGSTGLQNNIRAGEGQGIRILELPSRSGDSLTSTCRIKYQWPKRRELPKGEIGYSKGVPRPVREASPATARLSQANLGHTPAGSCAHSLGEGAEVLTPRYMQLVRR